jgi:hypothetical protein
MIKLLFMMQKETMYFEVDNKIIRYSDRFWKRKVQCVPQEKEFIQTIKNSRNKFPMQLVKMFTLTKEEQKEYDEASSDRELADIIIRDCRKKGLTFVKEIIE